nr:PREDICTED: RNA polymerase-associated protein LEO1-like isoform X2 [Bemisia tabaci]
MTGRIEGETNLRKLDQPRGMKLSIFKRAIPWILIACVLSSLRDCSASSRALSRSNVSDGRVVYSLLAPSKATPEFAGLQTLQARCMEMLTAGLNANRAMTNTMDQYGRIMGAAMGAALSRSASARAASRRGRQSRTTFDQWTYYIRPPGGGRPIRRSVTSRSSSRSGSRSSRSSPSRSSKRSVSGRSVSKKKGGSSSSSSRSKKKKRSSSSKSRSRSSEQRARKQRPIFPLRNQNLDFGPNPNFLQRKKREEDDDDDYDDDDEEEERRRELLRRAEMERQRQAALFNQNRPNQPDFDRDRFEREQALLRNRPRQEEAVPQELLDLIQPAFRQEPRREFTRFEQRSPERRRIQVPVTRTNGEPLQGLQDPPGQLLRKPPRMMTASGNPEDLARSMLDF